MPEKIKSLFSSKNFGQGEILLYVLVISIFIHYVLAAAVLIFIALAVLITNKYRRALKSLKFRFVGYAFCALTALVAAINNNWIGLLCSFGAFVIFITGHFAHSVMTTKVYETCLNLCCVCSYFVSVYAIIERICFWKIPTYRCFGLFFNPNYLATVMATVIIICAYKVIARQGNQLFYYITAAVCVLPLYFSGSMFIWVEMFIAVAVLLSLTNKHNVLSIFLIFVSFCCAIIYLAPDIIPRFSESSETLQNRLRIWELSIETIKLNPIFGKGFLTYYYMFSDFSPAYPTTHAHNIILEPILSFGILGTLTLITFFVLYYRRLLYCRSNLGRSHISALILALTAGVFVHSLVDMTMLWIQTAALYAIIMAGVGADEKKLNELIAQNNN
ncbi:MAG: O-antigen ligase family protein [Ruminococcaceae bacterium]|nr:O-antigen ligase family protein [Oscillospiraceae bacterium]